jgi:hypothetical protein
MTLLWSFCRQQPIRDSEKKKITKKHILAAQK